MVVQRGQGPAVAQGAAQKQREGAPGEDAAQGRLLEAGLSEVLQGVRGAAGDEFRGGGGGDGEAHRQEPKDKFEELRGGRGERAAANDG